MNSKRKCIFTAFTGACIAIFMTPVIAGSIPTYLRLGGTYCFNVGMSEAENFQHLKLVVEPTYNVSPYIVAPVNAVMRGMSGGSSYTDQLAGTATFAPSNDPAIETPMLQIALSGNGYGVTSVGEDEIWTFEYNLQLDPKTLNGKIYGAESESKPLVDGQSYEALQRSAVVRNLSRISCSIF